MARHDPISFNELKTQCRLLEDHAYWLSEFSSRMDASLHLMGELESDQIASVRALQREANNLADKFYQLFENARRKVEHDTVERDLVPPPVPYKLPRTDGQIVTDGKGKA